MSFLSARFLFALAALLAGGAITVKAWPDLAAGLTLSASVTAWTHDVTAPIAGRVPDEPPARGSPVGADGAVMEIVNDALDRTPMRNAEAALQAAQARLASATAHLELLRLDTVKRRDALLRATPLERTTDSENEIGRAGAELGMARAAEREAVDVLTREREAYRSKHSAVAKAPPGAVLHSVAGAGAAVQAGDPIARWIDCSELLVDAPVFDPWLRRLAVGGRGEVMLEGEDFWRAGEILAVRASGDVVGLRELAAVARGRDRGAGQVLLKLAVAPEDIDRCPVGRAAYVRLPELDLLGRLGLR